MQPTLLWVAALVESEGAAQATVSARTPAATARDDIRAAVGCLRFTNAPSAGSGRIKTGRATVTNVEDRSDADAVTWPFIASHGKN